jgi:RNA polymerase sigma factor (sigma-70 family)
MNESEFLAERFEEHRRHLEAVAYRMLGSSADAQDAVQDTWLRFSRAGIEGVDNVGGWLTTIVSRVCLNILRSRSTRHEMGEGPLPDPVIIADDAADPEREAVLADSVGLALLVVLEQLSPAERLAFVLHDMFQLSFDEIAPLVDRTPGAARQLASRARRRVSGASVPAPDPDLGRQRAVVDAFFAAARAGDFDALVAVLDPDVVLRADTGPAGGTHVVRGPEAVSQRARAGARPDSTLWPTLVNGGAGVVVTIDERVHAVMSFTVVSGRIAEIDVLTDPARLARIDPATYVTSRDGPPTGLVNRENDA